LLVLSELIPDRNGNFYPVRFSREWSLSVRVGEKKEFTLINAEHFRQSRDDLVGRVPTARFQVPNI